MSGWSFKEKRIALTLKQVAQERLSEAKNRSGRMGVGWETTDHLLGAYPRRKHANLRGYVVVPVSTIPAAKRIRVAGEWRIRLGAGQAYIYQRDQNTPNYLKKRIADQVGGGPGPVEVTVYNTCPTPVTASASPDSGSGEGDVGNVVLVVMQDMWGDLYIVERCEFPEAPSVSSSVSSSSGSEPSSGSGPSVSSQSGPSVSGSGSVSSSASSISGSPGSSDGGSVCGFTGLKKIAVGLTSIGGNCAIIFENMVVEDGLICGFEELLPEECCCANPPDPPSGGSTSGGSGS